jgi:hypothetical protein
MLKFIIFLALAIYIITKIGSFFFRAGMSSQQTRYQQQQRKPNTKPAGDANSRTDPRPGTIKGGDYVDYEEVK